MKSILGLVSFVSVCTLFCAANGARAAYPDKPIRIITAAGPGAGLERVARLFGAKLKDAWGQTVIVEGHPGADNMIAEDLVARAPPDGYTIMLSTAQRTLNAANKKAKVNYDLVNGLAPVTLIGTQPEVLIANPAKTPAKSLAEMIAMAKAAPGKLTYGDFGPGSSTDLAMKLFMQKSGTEFLEVPFKGTGEAMVALLGGEIDLMLGSVGTVGPQVLAGKLTALAVTDDVRNSLLPDVPTVAESLHLPSFAQQAWYGIFVPANTPKDIINKLHDGLAEAAKAPEIKDPLTRDGFTIVIDTPDQFGKFLKEETAMWSDMQQLFPTK